MSEETFGTVTRGDDVYSWTSSGWKSDTDPDTARFLQVAGIGINGVNSALPGAFEEALEQACKLIHGDKWECLVPKSTQPSGTVY